ncbi:hypothetical protein KC19_1G314100 [Ceratodon purpureus]|uniref:Serine aminopeptidase S33 domain-containing protein n=2 Tax=Ceratodon purpureus TaxID=3225 RepID=A0A8T0JCP8_CERPU|nr:hypothetical protein KC19_1G314100 [Ceratodon purpureus]
MVGLVTATMTMTYCAFLTCPTRGPSRSPALGISPSPSSVSASSRAHTSVVSALCLQKLSSSLVGWKQSLKSGSVLCLRDSQVGFVSASRLGACDQKSRFRCHAMADPSASPPAQEFTFVNKKGLKLKGLLVDGGAGSKEVCILCHGFRSSKLGGTVSALSAGLAEAGVSSFRFDFSGNGESEGKFAYGNYWQEVEDLRAAVEFWTSKGSRVVCVAGHSKGGNCVVLYASKYHDVPCVINISGRFALEKGILERFGGQEGLRKLEDEGVLDIKDASGNVEYQVTKADLRDRLTTNMHAACLAIPELTRVLTIHGTSDEVIPADDAYQFAQRIPTHKLVLVKDADHCYRGHQSELRKHVLEFLQETSALQESGAQQS